jgi:hypothetical protein
MNIHYLPFGGAWLALVNELNETRMIQGLWRFGLVE